jgi:hypothetical protein
MADEEDKHQTFKDEISGLEFSAKEVEAHAAKREREQALERICVQLEAKQLEEEEARLVKAQEELKKKKAAHAATQATPAQKKHKDVDFAAGLVHTAVRAEYGQEGFATFQESGVVEYRDANQLHNVELRTQNGKVRPGVVHCRDT